jgi:hypothetical protein
LAEKLKNDYLIEKYGGIRYGKYNWFWGFIEG